MFGLPSIPSDKYVWDGKSSFKDGIAIVQLMYQGYAYAACTFDAEKDDKPRVVKTFAQEPFVDVERIIVVPAFMDVNVEDMDLDEDSKRAAELLTQEADELTSDEQREDEKAANEINALPEWVFEEIHNKEEAQAWLQQYNSRNRIRGRVPENEETIKLRLLTIYTELKEKAEK